MTHFVPPSHTTLLNVPKVTVPLLKMNLDFFLILVAEPDKYVACQQDDYSTAARHHLKFNSIPWLVTHKFQYSRNILLSQDKKVQHHR